MSGGARRGVVLHLGVSGRFVGGYFCASHNAILEREERPGVPGGMASIYGAVVGWRLPMDVGLPLHILTALVVHLIFVGGTFWKLCRG